ncbi:MAG: endonuclease III [Clostridia bacterium]|nr:endonuclease III [Clostridia bacterium]
MNHEERIPQILSILETTYPDARPALNFESPYQLLTAVILSAQCTDVKVNKVTPELFRRYPDAAALAAAPVSDVEDVIRTCGLFHAKARNLIATARILTEQYGGEVPRTREALEALPGVGRKTANVVLSCAFGEDAIAVDTHVFRVSNRLGLADAPDVLKTEEQLMANIPKDQWSHAHHWLIFHGRQVCHSRNPACATCPLRTLCEYALGNPKGKK